MSSADHFRSSNGLSWPRCVVVALLVSGCGSQTPSTPQAQAPLGVSIDVLGGGCAGALTLATRVANLSSEPVRLNRIALRYTTSDLRCRSHQAPIDPSLVEVLSAG